MSSEEIAEKYSSTRFGFKTSLELLKKEIQSDIDDLITEVITTTRNEQDEMWMKIINEKYE